MDSERGREGACERTRRACERSDVDGFISQNTEEPKLLQFTASWCSRCHTLKAELVDVLDHDVEWLTVDLTAPGLEDVTEVFEVYKLPRVDVVGSGGVVVSLTGFDCTSGAILKAIENSRRPRLILDADF